MDRWIVVDNTNNGLNYAGSWSPVSGISYDRDGNFGRTYLTTLQSLTSGQGTISYNFRGTSGRVYGTSIVAQPNGNNMDPTWECSLDGSKLPMSNISPYPQNNWILCEFSGASDGSHTITITARSNGRAFLFDYFIYEPSMGQTLQNVVTGVSWRDSGVQYDSGWDGWGGAGYQGKNPGATLKFPFYGTAITFMGLTPREAAPGESQAEYFIDDQNPTRFTVPARASNTIFHQSFFRTGNVPLGHHTLTVVYRGQNNLMPLVFGHLLIDSTTFPPPAPPSSPPNNDNDNGGGNTGGSGAGTLPPAGSPSTTGGPRTSTGNTGNTGNTGSSNNGTFGGLPDPSASRAVTTDIIRVVTTTASDGSVRTTSVLSAVVTNVPVGGPSDFVVQPPASSAPGSWGSVGGDGTIFVGSSVEKSKPQVGAIIGGVLGAMAILGFFILAILKYRMSAKRKRVMQEHQDENGGYLQPFGMIPDNAPIVAQGDATSMHASNENPFDSDPIQVRSYQGGKGGIIVTGGQFVQRGLSPNRWGGTPSNSGSSEASSEVAPRPAHAFVPLSKHDEAQLEAQDWPGDQAVHHSDSGYRIPSPPRASATLPEYPPRYTAA